MTTFNCTYGQSLTDICLNTYGTLDNYIQLLNDNGLTPNDIPYTGLLLTWNETAVRDQTIQQLLTQNKTIYCTLYGLGAQLQAPTQTIHMYKESRATSYTASTDGETVITLTELQGNEVVQIEKEIKPLKTGDYVFDPVTGNLTLIGMSLATGETLFIIYSVKIFS
jgi:hypothetical protein